MSFATLLAASDGAVLQHLGGPVTYAPSVGAAVAVTGIFDAAYVPVSAGGQVSVSSSGPAVFLRLADLPSDPAEDEPTITVDARTYRVTEVQKDGVGNVLLLLHRVATAPPAPDPVPAPDPGDPDA